MLWGDLSTPEIKKNQKKELLFPIKGGHSLTVRCVVPQMGGRHTGEFPGSLESDFTESVEIVGNGKVFQIRGPQPHLSGSPNVGSNASGRSRRMISWRISQVKGSM